MCTLTIKSYICLLRYMYHNHHKHDYHFLKIIHIKYAYFWHMA